MWSVLKRASDEHLTQGRPRRPVAKWSARGSRGLPTRDRPKERLTRMPQFIFTMKDLRKVTPQGKEILKGIWLSFYGDAKIGVLGANGAGKSTLLRIMAGVDKDFAGEAFPAEGTRIGYLPQEPVLDPSKNVLEHVMEAVAEKKKIVERYEEISANYS